MSDDKNKQGNNPGTNKGSLDKSKAVGLSADKQRTLQKGMELSPKPIDPKPKK